MRTQTSKLKPALRLWQSQHDALHCELERLAARQNDVLQARELHRTEQVRQHSTAVQTLSSTGHDLLALHNRTMAHRQYDRRAAMQLQAVARQIDEKRSELLGLRRKLRQIEMLTEAADRNHARAEERRMEEQASYLFLIRQRPE